MTSTGPNQAPHVPVLVDQVIAALALHSGDTAVDGTFGAGGYARAMLGGGGGGAPKPAAGRGGDG